MCFSRYKRTDSVYGYVYMQCMHLYVHLYSGVHCLFWCYDLLLFIEAEKTIVLAARILVRYPYGYNPRLASFEIPSFRTHTVLLLCVI